MRIGLFLLTNAGVVMVLSIVLNVLGIGQGGNMLGLVLITSLFGMGGAFISLMMSKSMALRSVGASVITKPKNEVERWLIEIVEKQARKAGIGMPDVAIFESASPNAFATGANKNSSLVAVSTGLLKHMEANEVEAVMAHEISHVANGDMVTLTLLQGVMNTFVMIFAHILAAALDKGRRGMGYFIGYYIAQSVLGFLAAMVVMWFSRYREFRADSGGGELAGVGNMISALEKLKVSPVHESLPDSVDAFGISGGIGQLLSSHPPLDKRIQRLREQL